MIGFWERVAFAFRCLFSILFLARIPDDIARKLVQPAAPLSPASPTPSVSRLKELERPPAETFDRAVQILALLQRDGRLVDFLAENISPYPDVQLGAAVRTIHENYWLSTSTDNAASRIVPHTPEFISVRLKILNRQQLVITAYVPLKSLTRSRSMA